MKYIYIYPLVLFLNLLEFQAYSQNAFQKLYYTGGGFGYSLKLTSDHGFVMAGVAGTVGGQTKISVVKTDSLGNIQWGNSYDGNDTDIAEFIGQTSDGGYFVVGSTKSGTSLGHDFFLMRIDSLGNLMWAKTYGGSANDQAYFGEHIQNNGFIIGGYTESYGAGLQDVYIIRTDEMGDTLWTRTYGTIHYENSLSMAKTPDSAFVISGSHKSGNLRDLLLVKINLNGDIIWSKLIKTGYNESGDEIHLTSDTGFIVTGSVSGGHIRLMKVDSIGSPQWAKYYGSEDKWANSVKQTYDLGYIMTGVAVDSVVGFTEALLIKTDNIGNVLWSQKYGKQGYDHGIDVIQTPDSGYAFTGIFTPYPSNFNNMGLIKTDSLGISGCFEYSFGINSFSPTLTDSNIVLPVSTGAIVAYLPLNMTSPNSVTTYCASVGFESVISEPILTVSPIPANNYLTINLFNTIPNGYLEIVNPIGNILLRENISDKSRIEINVHNVTQGIYVLRLFDGVRFLYRRILIEH